MARCVPIGELLHVRVVAKISARVRADRGCVVACVRCVAMVVDHCESSETGARELRVLLGEAHVGHASLLVRVHDEKRRQLLQRVRLEGALAVAVVASPIGYRARLERLAHGRLYVDAWLDSEHATALRIGGPVPTVIALHMPVKLEAREAS